MTQAILHHTDISSPPVGIWWVDDVGALQSHYVDTGEADELLGRQAMFLKLPGAPWAQHFAALAELTPIIMGWEPIEANDDPASLLMILRRMGQRTE